MFYLPGAGRRRTLAVWLASAALVTIALVGSNVTWTYLSREETWKFVAQVLLESEFDGPQGQVIRWSRSPVVYLHQASERDVGIVEDVVTEVNDTLRTAGVTMRFGGLVESTILVVFDSLHNFEQLAEDYDVEYVPGQAGMFWTRVRGPGEIFFALIFVANEATGAWRRTVIAQEIIQALGPSNDSAVDPTSLFFEIPNSEGPRVTRLSKRDRKLLRFLYERLQPGDDAATVRAAFDRYWVD